MFLSHSGLDALSATTLAADLKAELGLEIFNTSDSEYRYTEVQEGIDPSAYDEELKEYLKRHLAEAAVYVLLVTPRSLKARSAWIAFEMRMAHEKSLADRRRFFIPCVADGVKLFDLPEPAREFHGIELDGSPERFAELVVSVHQIFLDRRRFSGEPSE